MTDGIWLRFLSGPDIDGLGNVTMIDDLFDLDEIGEIVAGRKPGRENDAERNLFWHRGLSSLDVAIAHLILRRAEAADAGTMLRFH